MTDLLVLAMVLTFFTILYLIDFFSARERALDPSDYATFLFNKDQYYNSPEWATRRATALAAAHHTCEMCHSPHNLEVHHITYAHIFQERPADLAVVCHTCHTAIHTAFGHPTSLVDYSTQRYSLLVSHY